MRLDEAAALIGQAIAQAGPLEYDLAEADGTLGLAEVALRRGRLDQALANGMQAAAVYDTLGSGLGTAEANRVLGEVQLRRGQLAQSIATFDRAARAFQALRVRPQQAHALLGSAEANRRKSLPRKAEDLFAQARAAAGETGQTGVEAATQLGLGQIARQRGQAAAAQLLAGAAEELERAGRPALAALAEIERAQLALTRGQ